MLAFGGASSRESCVTLPDLVGDDDALDERHVAHRTAQHARQPGIEARRALMMSR
jgi:hypothetical protein